MKSLRIPSYASLILLTTSLLQANPTGGSVAAGSASISGTGTANVTINQGSNTVIINWNSFSIGHGETTTFLQPSASSAALNRVLGGSISSINGTLNANGQVYLINGNGIFIGNGAAINTSGFTASTLDITNSDFLKGKLQFNGASTAGVQNSGAINAIGGDIYLIGRTVDNEGSLNATGTVGLASAQSVLIKQSGSEHVFVSPSTTATASSATAVTNKGSIAAATAELRAANGNMYALAINNGGSIRATTVQNQGGHVYLTSDSGVIANTGSVNASATASKGKGGNITFKTGTTGTVVNQGAVIAHGGQGGTGGTVDLSGGTLDFKGGVDLTTQGGTTGNLLLDPNTINITNNQNANGVLTVSGAITTYMPAPNFNGSELYVQTLEAQLALANVIVNGINNVTVSTAITWGNATASTSGQEFGNSLTLQTTGKGGTININAPITAHVTPIPPSGNNPVPPPSILVKDTLIIDNTGNGFVTTGANGTIDVDNFTLKNGHWQQIVSPNAPTTKQPGLLAVLPAFNVSNDFQLQGTSTFERFNGGNGLLPTAKAPTNAPYAIDDVYGLQGIGSPSGSLLGLNFIQDQDINSNTTNWNGGNGDLNNANPNIQPTGGAGFLPIGEGGKTVKPFTGSYNGANFAINGIYIFRPADNLGGMFGEVSGKVLNVNFNGRPGEGGAIFGGLIGRLLRGGQAISDFTTLSGQQLLNPGLGTVDNQAVFKLGVNDVNGAGGGLIGEVMQGGTVLDCSSDIVFQLIGGPGSGASGITGHAGLVGVNYGTITNSFSSGSGTTALNVVAGNNPRATAANSSVGVGGLVGINFGTINGGGAIDTTISTLGTAPVNGVPVNPPTSSIVSGIGNFYVGGFVGVNYGTIDSTITVKVNGVNTKVTYQAFTNNDVIAQPGSDIDGGSGSYYVGGFAGANYGTITNGYSAPVINGVSNFSGGTVLASGDLQPGGIGEGTGAVGDYLVGGFAGGNFGKIIHSGTEDRVLADGDINGIGVTRVFRGGQFVTVPATANFTAPLSLDSYMVGGFVGLNGQGSSITGSFSDDNNITINFTLDPNTPLIPTFNTNGDSFTLSPNNGGPGNDLISTTGNITGGAGFYIVGGFGGANYGTINTSYSKGDVNVSGTTTQSNSFYTSGFVGLNSGTIANVFETGSATSLTSNGPNPANQTGVVGGLVAQQNAGSIATSYSLGTVLGGTTRGGLAGVVAKGTVTKSFWERDSNLSLNDVSAGGAGAQVENAVDLQTNTAGFLASVFGQAKWNNTTIWQATPTTGFLTLKNVP